MFLQVELPTGLLLPPPCASHKFQIRSTWAWCAQKIGILRRGLDREHVPADGAVDASMGTVDRTLRVEIIERRIALLTDVPRLDDSGSPALTPALRLASKSRLVESRNGAGIERSAGLVQSQ